MAFPPLGGRDVVPRQRPSPRVRHITHIILRYINVRDVSKLRQPLATNLTMSATRERLAATEHSNAYHAQEGYKTNAIPKRGGF